MTSSTEDREGKHITPPPLNTPSMTPPPLPPPSCRLHTAILHYIKLLFPTFVSFPAVPFIYHPFFPYLLTCSFHYEFLTSVLNILITYLINFKQKPSPFSSYQFLLLCLFTSLFSSLLSSTFPVSIIICPFSCFSSSFLFILFPPLPSSLLLCLFHLVLSLSSTFPFLIFLIFFLVHLPPPPPVTSHARKTSHRRQSFRIAGGGWR